MGEFAYVDTLLEGALDKSGQPVKRGTMAHDHDVYALLTDSAAQRRDLDALERYAPRLEELASRDGHRLYQAVAHRALGVASRLKGDYAVAETRFEKALAGFEDLGTRWQTGITLFEMAELDQARSAPDQRKEHLLNALAHFRDIRANPDAERTRVLIEAL